MHNILLDPNENISRLVVVTQNDYPASSIFPSHLHQRSQFAFAARGMMSVFTEHENLIIPPQRACWIPAGVAHEMQMHGPVTMLNAFFIADDAQTAEPNDRCRVLAVSPLLKLLLQEAVDLPLRYEPETRAGKIMALLLDEIKIMPTLSLNTPLPTTPRLAQLCHELMSHPSKTIDINMMASDVALSRRSFTRLFRAETGISFTQWRQQACLLAAIDRLAQGESITNIALDLGYGSPSTFTALFQRILGISPSQYRMEIMQLNQ